MARNGQKQICFGEKINFVHNAITQKKLGEETSQIGFEKMFKPVTSKLDDVIASNLGPPRLAPPGASKKKKAKLEGIDYFPDVDPFEDMDVEGLFDETAPVSPQPEKQIRPSPPTYEEIVKEVGKIHLHMKKMKLPIMLWNRAKKQNKAKRKRKPIRY